MKSDELIQTLGQFLQDSTNHTDDDLETLAEVAEEFAVMAELAGATSLAHEKREEALKARLAKLSRMCERGEFASAHRYHDEHALLALTDERDLVRRWCEHMKAQERVLWHDILGLARRYGFLELAREAAIAYSKEWLASPADGWDPQAFLDIARHERADDPGYREQAVRRAFRGKIRSRRFGELPGIVTEFRQHFSDAEVELADFLSRMEKDRSDRRYARIAAQRP